MAYGGNDGTPSPLANTANTLTVSIGGKDAPVQFAGLTPGFVGLYQVNVAVPDNVPKGDAVPATISVAGQVGPAAPLPVH